MKKSYVIAFALLIIGWGAIVCAAPPEQGAPPPGPGWAHQGPPDGPGGPHHWAPMHHKMGTHLGLSKEQKEKMREIRKSFLADTHDLRYDIRLKHIEMRKLYTDPKATNESVLAKQREINALIMKLMDRKALMRVELRKLLTPEQIGKLDRPGFFKFHHHHGHFEH